MNEHPPELVKAPRKLQRISTPPDDLWIRGSEALLHYATNVAIVGARSCSAYGRGMARMFATELVNEGAVIVSGLARGIDGEAHRAAVKAGGKTIAVLGCGIDRIYPAGHTDLAHYILDHHGAIVSEYEPGVEPAPWRFPARNRIIAGLVGAVIVIEARERSGALITVDYAIDAGIPVYAVPGEITGGLSAGTNELIRSGRAQMLTSPEQIALSLGAMA